MKSKFLAAVSHDLRQPLYSMNLFIDALEPHIQDQGDPIKLQLRRSTQVLNSMFDNLLDITRLETGVVIPNLAHVEIQTLLNNMRDEFEWLANQKNLKLAINAIPQLVHTDAELLKCILRNLISNAIRYTEHGEIKVDCLPNGSTLRLAIVDTGIGIGSENIDKIFDDYFQVENNNPRTEKGLGLGLAIVRRMEKLLWYQMTVNSTLGHGTRFEFNIPLQAERR